MKTELYWKLSFMLALGLLPLAGGCYQDSAFSAPADAATTDQEPAMAEAADPAETTATNAAAEAEIELEHAKVEVLSTAKPPANVKLSSPAMEVVKLAEAGVDESVMLAFVNNSPYVFALDSNDIIYLNDVGVPGSIVTAMIQRDESLRAAQAAQASAQNADTNQTVAAPDAAPVAYPIAETAVESVEVQPAPVEVVESVAVPEPVYVSDDYFYDSLAPYGSWYYVSGYGRCWRPTVAIANSAWRPYCDRGRWIYSDCGWYWASDYSWGWAPFHYGRWFQHANWGWCWMPGTVWGPSWVSWRYAPGYCGWAPLPPAATWTAGFGFSYSGQSVGASFGFGLTSSSYAFVPVNRFLDPHLSRHRLSRSHVNQVFDSTVVHNEIVEDHQNRAVNRGLPSRNIGMANGVQIRPVPVRDVAKITSTRAERREGGQPVAVYRPTIPQVEAKPTATTESSGSPAFRAGRPLGRTATVNRSNPAGTPAGVSAQPPTQPVSISRTQPSAPAQNFELPNTSARIVRSAQPTQRTAPLILRGADRAATSNNDRETARPRTWPAPNANNPNNANRPSFNPSMQPATPAPGQPAQNYYAPPMANPNQRQTTISVPQSQYQFAPNAQQQQNPRTFRQETPQYQQPDQRTVSQPYMPAQRQPAMPTYQSPRAADSGQAQSWASPPAQRSAPVSRQEAPAPRTEVRQAPQQATPSAPHQPGQPARFGGR